MFTLLDYADDITRSLKVGVFISFAGMFMIALAFVVKTIRDQNENNQ